MDDWLDNENWIDEKYHEKINRIFDLSGICGCGDPEGTLLLMVDILETASPPNFTYEAMKKYEEVHPNLGYLILYLLTDKELIEHGSGVYGSWLTSKGEELISLVRELSEKGTDIG